MLTPSCLIFGIWLEVDIAHNLQVNSVTELSGQICQICGDEIEITVDGEPFVACNECAFPVCRPCYEYERREGNQACPQCKTRYKRLKGESSTNFYFHVSVIYNLGDIDFSNNGANIR